MMKKTDMNLYDSYRNEQKAQASHTSPVRLYLAIFIFTALILSAFGVKLFVDNLSLKNKIEAINEYINDPNIKQKVAEINDIQKKLVALDDINARVEKLNEVFADMPRYDSKVLDILYYERPNDIYYTQLSYEENTVYIEFAALRASSASNYALNLQHTDQFADVSYEEYAYDPQYGVYRGVIMCMLKGGN